MFIARVARTVSAAHHNGPDGNKCQRNHGHDWQIELEIAYHADDLDEYGWGPDFGRIKRVLDAYDHHDLNEVITKHPPSAERFAMTLVADVEAEFEGRYRVHRIVVHEGNANTIEYFPPTTQVEP